MVTYNLPSSVLQKLYIYTLTLQPMNTQRTYLIPFILIPIYVYIYIYIVRRRIKVYCKVGYSILLMTFASKMLTVKHDRNLDDVHSINIISSSGGFFSSRCIYKNIIFTETWTKSSYYKSYLHRLPLVLPWDNKNERLIT